MKKSLALLLALAMMLSLALTGCGGGSTGGETASDGTADTADTADTAQAGTESEVTDVTLKVWVPEEEVDMTTRMAESFKAAHPEYNLTFDISITGIDESVALLETDADTAADVFQIPSGSVLQCTNEGLLLPIGYDEANIRAMYGEGAITASEGTDGLLYGVPFSPNSFFMFYNKAMYTEDEVKSLETMMAKDLGTTAEGEGIYNFSFTIHNSWYLESFFYAAGCSVFGQDGKDPTAMDWNNEQGFKAGMYAINLSKDPKYLEDEDGIAMSMLKNGRLAALCSGTWSASDVKEALGENYGACALPTIQIDGQDCQLRNFSDYKCFGVKSSTQYPLAAQQFAEWLANEENQKIRYEEQNITPTCLSLVDDPELAADPATTALLAQSEFAVAQPSIPQIGEYWTPVEALGTGIINGEITEANLQEKLDAVVAGVTGNLVG